MPEIIGYGKLIKNDDGTLDFVPEEKAGFVDPKPEVNHDIYHGRRSAWAFSIGFFVSASILAFSIFMLWIDALPLYYMMGFAIAVIAFLKPFVELRYYERIEVANGYLYLYQGIFNTKKTEIPIDMAEKREFQNFFQKLVNVGSIELTTKGDYADAYLAEYGDFKNLSDLI
jgi:uncharacterized membrane protein YdbT with pleckstrin-like domain